MVNAKWYLVCDMRTKTARDLIQLDNTWGTVTGLLEQSDEDLEHLSLWALNHPGISFLPVARAVELGVDADSIQQVVTATRPAVLAWVRGMRDPMLQASDSIMGADRWASLDVVAQAQVTAYRQALRDITSAPDLLNLTWPPIPPALDSLRQFNTGEIYRPSEQFLAMLTSPFPELPLAQKRLNQCLRIKALRDQRKAGGVKVMVDGKPYWFWTDEPSRNQYALLCGIVLQSALPDDHVLESAWKTMSGEYVPFTVGTLNAIIQAGLAYETTLFNVAKNHASNVMTSTSPETYDYSTGWPPSYADTQ